MLDPKADYRNSSPATLICWTLFGRLVVNFTASFNSFDDPELKAVTGLKSIIRAQVPAAGAKC